MKRKISKLILSVCAVSAIVIGLSGNGKAFAQSDPFIGQISYVGFNFAPVGWAFCDGQLLPISQNQALFALLGDRFGGDSRTTFALPDMRGRVPIHKGKGPGLRLTYIMGGSSGIESIKLKVEQMPAHSHDNSAVSTSESTVNSGSMTGSLTGTAKLKADSGDAGTADPAGNSLAKTGGGGGKGGSAAQAYSTTAPGADMNSGSIDLSGVGVSISGAVGVTTETTTTVAIEDTGGDNGFGIMQPYLVLNCIIAMEGVFPQRQ